MDSRGNPPLLGGPISRAENGAGAGLAKAYLRSSLTFNRHMMVVAAAPGLGAMPVRRGRSPGRTELVGGARRPLLLGTLLVWLAGAAETLSAEPLTLDTPRFRAQAELGNLVSLRDASGVVLVTSLANSQGLLLHRIDNEHRVGLESGPAVWDGTGAVERVLTNFTGLPGATARCRYAVDSISGDLLISQTCTSPAPGVWGVEWSIANIPLEYNIVVPGFSGVKLTRSSGGGLTTQSFDYPMSWEAQLVVVEGDRHGFYVWSDDAAARFKRLTVLRTTQGWQLGFISINHAPFDGLRQCASVSWRLNT